MPRIARNPGYPAFKRISVKTPACKGRGAGKAGNLYCAVRGCCPEIYSWISMISAMGMKAMSLSLSFCRSLSKRDDAVAKVASTTVSTS